MRKNEVKDPTQGNVFKLIFRIFNSPTFWNAISTIL